MALMVGMNFNPRSREGSDPWLRRGCGCRWYFNPRSREGSDLRASGNGRRLQISIHAPVKGATAFDCLNDEDKDISIHAPVKGATWFARSSNSGSRISIHAPVKGATRPSARNRPTRLYFNPRSREGSDLKPKAQSAASVRFQSTLP